MNRIAMEMEMAASRLSRMLRIRATWRVSPMGAGI
jgi:hypothetical protein